jgi:hypothetical protein
MTVKQVYILTSTQPPIQGDERIYGLIGLGETRAMPDLPLCLGVLNHRAPVGQSWGIFLQSFFYGGFLLLWCEFVANAVYMSDPIVRGRYTHVGRDKQRIDLIQKQATIVILLIYIIDKYKENLAGIKNICPML